VCSSDLRSDDLPALIGQAPSFLGALEQASATAALNRPLLVIGERGTGKELVAARVHFLSPRWDQEYVKVNCAALSDELLESELFGHEAGSFTGATKRHQGRFERADGGTVFLDEIANASARVQEKILRVIEYGEFERVGGDRTLTTDVRIIAATNEDLPAKAAAGEFRADLLDRLAFDVVTLPPLRVRWEDIPILAEHFAQRMAAELGAESFSGFSMRAMGALMDHTWPGNVRELRNVVERAVHRNHVSTSDMFAPVDDVVIDPFASPWRPGVDAAAEAEAGSHPDSSATAPTEAGGQPHREILSGSLGNLEDTAANRDVSALAAPPAPRLDTPFAAQTRTFEIAILRGALAAESGHQGRVARRDRKSVV